MTTTDVDFKHDKENFNDFQLYTTYLARIADKILCIVSSKNLGFFIRIIKHGCTISRHVRFLFLKIH